MSYPSSFLDLQNEVINKIRLDATADLAKVKDWINQVYTDVCIDTEAIQAFATFTLTSGSAIYTMDSTLRRIKQMYCTPVGGSQSRPLQPISLEQILEWNTANPAVTNVGGVNYYAIFGLSATGVINIQFYPTPQSADVVTVYYTKTPTVLSANGDLPVIPEPFATECLVGGASYKAALFLKDPDASVFKQDYDAARARLRGHLRRMTGAMTQQFRVWQGQQLRPHDPSVDIRYVA